MERTISGVGVLDKSMAVLGAVADSESPQTLTELVASVGLPKATTHRLASALEEHGMLARDADGRYRLGDRLVRLGQQAEAGWSLGDLAMPALEWLRRETTESVQLYVRSGEDRICLRSLPSSHELRTIVAEGARLPLHLGSAGRVLLGQTGEQGWVASIGERSPDVASVSAPVVVDGRVVAAVGISGPRARLGEDPAPGLGEAVAQAAALVSAAR